MHYQKVFKMPESIPYPSVGFDVGADFTRISIMLPSGIPIGRSFRVIRSGPQSRELVVSKIKEVQEMYSFESRCLLKSIGIYHIPLPCFFRDKGFDCAAINPIITENSTNMNVGKLHNDKLNLRRAAKVGPGTSLKASIVPDDVIVDLYNLVRDYYYFKDLQSAIVLKLHAELRVSFPVYLSMFSKVITQALLRPLEARLLATDMLVAPKDELMETTCSTARLGETYALTRYDAICTAAKDIVVSGRALPSNALRIRLYIKMYRKYQAHPDNILGELHQAVDKLEGTPDYDRISSIQALYDVGFLSTVVLVVEMGSFDPFSSSKKPYAYFGLDLGVNDPSRFHGDKVHMSKRGSSLARHILYMAAINSLKVDKATKTPVNPVIYDYCTRKCASKRKSVAVGTVMYKIYNITSTTLRDNKPFELITPGGHRERYTAEHSESASTAT